VAGVFWGSERKILLASFWKRRRIASAENLFSKIAAVKESAMFERFSDNARRVMAFANMEAQQLGCVYGAIFELEKGMEK
jgi:hypothetical protein